MSSEKKCPHCGQWTSWNQRPEDTCTHCGGVLDPRTVQQKEDRIARERKQVEDSFFTEKPDDNLPMKAVRKVAFVAHAIYAAIVWFFLMMFASTPG